MVAAIYLYLADRTLFVEDLLQKLSVEGGLWEVSMEGMFVALVVVKLTERVQKIKRTFYCFGNTGPCLYIWVEGPDLFFGKKKQ